MEKWDLYDRAGNNLDKSHQRGAPLLPGTYHLVVCIWIQNDEGKYLIQQRNKPVSDGRDKLWTCAAAGAAQEGETSNQAIIRELKEELGLDTSPESLHFQDRVIHDDFFMDTWLLNWNGAISKLSLDLVEVADVKWVSKEQILNMVSADEFFDEGSKYYRSLVNE